MGAQSVASNTQSILPDDDAATRMFLERSIEKCLQHERTATFQDYLRIFTYATRLDLLACAAGVLATMGSGVTQPLMFILFGNFVGQFSAFVPGSDRQELNKTQNTLNRLCLLVTALFIARFGLASIHKFAFRMIGIRLSAAIRLHYLKSLFDQSIHVLDSLPPGHAVGVITSSSNILQIGISEKLGTFIEYSTLIIASFVVAFTWSWELSLVTLAGFVVVLLIVGTLFPLTVKGQTQQTKFEGQAAATASESFAGIHMIMACGAQQQIVNKYGAFVEGAKKQAQSTNPLTSLQFALTFLGVFGTIALTFWYGTLIFTNNRLDDVGVITVVLLCLTTIFFSLDRVSIPIQAVGKASQAACEFFSVIDAPIPEGGSLKEPLISAREDIVFDKVTFAYPSRPAVKVLDQLDMRIEAGKITAIVGPSGSGKSTIIGLIERWYILRQQHAILRASQSGKDDKQVSLNVGEDHSQIPGDEFKETGNLVELQGTITTCGHSLDDVDIKWWRSKIGLVQQEPFVFNDTIYKNVARGLIGSRWEEEPEERKRQLVKEACQEAFADEFIDKLPLGYDTNVGDGGTRLSGGQRQRLAIARSIIKRPDILILDEATSAIDVRGERIVQDALDKAARHRTTIVIAHRLSTIKNADRILVLKKGKIIESGTHESLINTNGSVYSGLVNAQALSLGDPTRNLQNSFQKDDVDITNRQDNRPISGYDDEHHSQQKSEVTDVGRLFGSFGLLFYESKDYWGIMAFGLLASAAAGTAQPLHAWLFARSIDLFKWQDNPAKLMNEVSFMGIMWTVFAASAGIVYFITFVCSGHVASVIRAKYQTQYFQSLVFQRATYFDKDGHSHGTLVSRVRDGPLKLEEMMGVNVAQVCISIYNIFGGLIMALVYSWKLALVSLCAVTPLCIFSGYIRFRYEVQFENMNDEVFAHSSQFASEAIGAFRTVTSMTLENSILDRFEKLCHGHVTSAYKKARWVSIILGFSESTNLGCQALIFFYGGRLLIQGEIGIMAFFVCLTAIMSAVEGFGKSLSFGPNAAQATTASKRIMDARNSSLMDPIERDDIPVEGRGVGIELRDIHLTYSTQKMPVFQGLNMTIERGQFAALVGASGCGKTSIISLLERFSEPDKGQILFNGKDISDVNIYKYRKHLSLVAQEPTLFRGTIRDNILLGLDPNTITDDQLHAACRDALIHDFIVSLPESYNTNVGSGGVALSGGQKQRISIARALVRNPRVLLLDEATSSLDSESERLVQAAFERAARGRTMVVVAHRLSTVQNADIIFVLGEGGQLLEKGDHLELLGKRGVYYQMCQNQALDR